MPPTTLDSLPNDLILLIADKCADACSEEDPAVLARLACVCRSVRRLLVDPSSDASDERWLRAFACAARGGGRTTPAASLLDLDSWWRPGRSNQASYGALVKHLCAAQRAPPPAPPPLPPSSPAGASAAAAWAAEAIERIIEAQAAAAVYDRMQSAVEPEDDDAEELSPDEGEGAEPTTHAHLLGLTEERLRELLGEAAWSSALDFLCETPVTRHEVQIHKATRAAFEAAEEAAKTCVVAAAVAERAIGGGGGMNASSLPPVAGGSRAAVEALGTDVQIEVIRAIGKVGTRMCEPFMACADEHGGLLGLTPAFAGLWVEEGDAAEAAEAGV